jgi:hypothetical protein
MRWTASARLHLQELALSQDRMWEALTKVPFSLKDAAIFFKAQEFHVGYEAAAILAVKSVAQVLILISDMHFLYLLAHHFRMSVFLAYVFGRMRLVTAPSQNMTY